MNPIVELVTHTITTRSRDARKSYEARMRAQATDGPHRAKLSCGNLAHAAAACAHSEKETLASETQPNLAIVSAYNDMLSAHQPFERFPELIKAAARDAGAVAQFAGGVPAMCDGVTQGRPGMELSLFSRDVIAMSTAVALSHDMFDGILCLGVCDKIVPGLVIGALSFGHLPVVFVPAGPMPTGISNAEKSKVRKQYARGEIGRKELLVSESQAYHSPGTCTFYGTANSNQMLMEFMGLHLPGTSFVAPNTDLRDALTRAATERAVAMTALRGALVPMMSVIDERAVVNGIVGLLATGGSTNHTLHLVAMARAAGIIINWDDFAALSDVVPLLARVYPNGAADVNQMHAAGGLGFLIGQLLDAGLLHEDVTTVAGEGLSRYREAPALHNGRLEWAPVAPLSQDESILRPHYEPFAAQGGLRVVDGSLGRGVVKVSSVEKERRTVMAMAKVFDHQDDFLAAFKAGELDCDHVAVIRFQGPKANGMPELHKLTPSLTVLQERGFRVALVTDGRMSGASGKVPAAIHLTPEALDGGPLARVQDGDLIQLDCDGGRLDVLVDAEAWSQRTPATPDVSGNRYGLGRELFAGFRANVGRAEDGASVLSW